MIATEALCLLILMTTLSIYVSYTIASFSHSTKVKPITTYRNVKPSSVPVVANPATLPIVSTQGFGSSDTDNSINATVRTR